MASWIGERETNGANRSPLIDYMNRNAGAPLGSPYCSSAIKLALDSAEATYPTRRTALARNYRTGQSVRAVRVLSGRDTVPLYSIAIWQNGNTIKGHCEIVTKVLSKSRIETIGANTTCRSTRGSERDGDGICRKTREIQPYNYFGLKWFTPVRYA